MDTNLIDGSEMRNNEKNIALLIKWCKERCEGCEECCDNCSVNAVKQLLVYTHNQKVEIERLKTITADAFYDEVH